MLVCQSEVEPSNTPKKEARVYLDRLFIHLEREEMQWRNNIKLLAIIIENNKSRSARYNSGYNQGRERQRGPPEDERCMTIQASLFVKSMMMRHGW